MTLHGLRMLVRRYGRLGLCVAACYVGWRHLRAKRGTVGPLLGAIALAVAGLLFFARGPGCRGTGGIPVVPARQASRATSARAALPPAPVKVADLHGWWAGSPITADYQWVSDAVLFTGTTGWRLEEPFLYDIRSRRKTPLPQLSRLLRRDGNGVVDDWQLSPDGCRLLWTMQLHSDVRSARLDGSDYQVVELPPSANTVGRIGWRSNYEWTAEGYDHGSAKLVTVLCGDVNRPGWSRTLSPAKADASPAGADVSADTDNNSLSVDLPGTRGTDSTIVTLHPPAGMQVCHAEINPAGDRLAWLLVDRQTEESSRPERTIAVWFSRLDGSEMRQAAGMTVKVGSEDFDDPRALKWLPSGRAVSFLYEDALWTVTANGW